MADKRSSSTANAIKVVAWDQEIQGSPVLDRGHGGGGAQIQAIGQTGLKPQFRGWTLVMIVTGLRRIGALFSVNDAAIRRGRRIARESWRGPDLAQAVPFTIRGRGSGQVSIQFRRYPS